jgi:thioesterase domain-containing protein
MSEAILTVQESGPYRLGGHCFGGLVAFEIARQLRRQGEEVEYVAIIDAPAPLALSVPPTDPGPARWIEIVARAWGEVAGTSLAVTASDLDSLDETAQLQVLRRAMVSSNLLPPEAGVNHIRGLINVFRANSLARYRPNDVLPVPIKLFRASESHAQFDYSALEDPGVSPSNSTLGWKWLSTEPVTVYPVPGNHLTMLAGPGIAAIAHALQTQVSANKSIP